MGVHESITFIFFFAALFGVCYIFLTTRHRERISMIDKGLSVQFIKPVDPLRSLKNGLLLIGIGVGFVMGYFFHVAVMGEHSDAGPLPYFVGMCIFGGLALVLFYIFFGRKQQG